MIREFTESVGRFAKGVRKDYPNSTWRGIESSAGKPLDEFSRPLPTGRSADPYVPKPHQEDVPGTPEYEARLSSPGGAAAATAPGGAAPAAQASSLAAAAAGGAPATGRKRN